MLLQKEGRGDTRPGELVFCAHYLLIILFEGYNWVVALVVVVVIMEHHNLTLELYLYIYHKLYIVS